MRVLLPKTQDAASGLLLLRHIRFISHEKEVSELKEAPHGYWGPHPTLTSPACPSTCGLREGSVLSGVTPVHLQEAPERPREGRPLGWDVAGSEQGPIPLSNFQ